MDKLAGFLALLVLGGFLAILGWKVPSPDLLAVIAVTILLALIDYLRAHFGRR